MERVSRIDFNPHRHINIPLSSFRAKLEQIYAGDVQGDKNIDRLLFTDGLRDEVQLRGEAVLSAERSI